MQSFLSPSFCVFLLGIKLNVSKNELQCSKDVTVHGVLKARILKCLAIDITLPTKVRLVKAMVFPVVMYGCEGWTVKKAEH